MNNAHMDLIWKNYPSEESPVNEENLNRMVRSINLTDENVHNLDSNKATKDEVAPLIADVQFDESTGTFIFIRKDSVRYEARIWDTKLEQLVENLDFDEEAQELIIIRADGTRIRVDVSAFVKPNEFLNSDTILFSIENGGKVRAIVKEGSIEEKHLRPDYLAEITVEAAKAQASASSAESSANASIASANAAELSANSAQTSEINAARSADTATQKATEAETSAENASASALSASNSSANATSKANEAETSAVNAANAERAALSNANAASASASNASVSASNADTYAKKSQSYAVGGTGTRENEDSDNAKYYYEQAKHISQGANGLIPMGTVSFENIPTKNILPNTMYNISNDFFSDERFLDGGGIFYGRGSNIYYTVDGKWDVLASSSVTGVKGELETSYRQGNVNITPANIGAVPTSYLNEHFVADYVSKSGKKVDKAGWYRIAKATGQIGENSCVISLKRSYNIGAPEFQKIQFMASYTSKKFVPLAAYTGQYGIHIWTKIRHVREKDQTGHTTSEELSEYIEVYYDGEGKSNFWLITVEDALGVYSNHWKAITPVLTAETVENVQVNVTLDLPENFDMSHLLKKTGDTIRNSVFHFEGDCLFKFMPGNVGSAFARGATFHDRNGNEVGGIGMFGSTDAYTAAYMSVGSATPWSPNAGLYITANDIKWKNSEIVTENSGNAPTATKAAQDGNGNVISSTYAKQSQFNGEQLALCVNSKANGARSIALGKNANASKNSSIAIGESTKASNSGTTALGYATNATGISSSAFGYMAGVHGSNAIALGSFSSSSGYVSVAIGDASIASANYAIAIGRSTYATGIDSIAIGAYANATGISSSAFGYMTNASGNNSTTLGERAVTSNANSIQLGNASRLSSITARVAITVTSDERDKADITEMDSMALDFLKKVKAIRYVFNSRELYIDDENLSDEERKNKEKYGLCAYDREEHAKGTKKGNRIRTGVSAQNVLQALKEVYGDASYANLVNDNFFDLDQDKIPEGVENQLAVNYEGFIPFLIKAVQELSERLEELESKNGEGMS